MKANMVYADRVVRMFFSMAFLVLYFCNLIPAGMAIGLSVLAVVFLITSFTGFCPIYGVLGINKKKAV